MITSKGHDQSPGRNDTEYIVNPICGDRGQRYMVTQVKTDGTSMVVGWTDEQDGGALASAFMKHPETAIVRVVDRGDSHFQQHGTARHDL